jgi:hypothetical protein
VQHGQQLGAVASKLVEQKFREELVVTISLTCPSKGTTSRLERASSRSTFPESSLPATGSQIVPIKLLGTEVLSKDSLPQ